MRSKLSSRSMLFVWLTLAILITHSHRTVSAQDGYPPPNPEPALSSDSLPHNEAYPVPESELPPPIEIETIGAGQDGRPVDSQPSLSGMQLDAVQPGPSSSGAIFLWGSFLAALLLFATAVLGSIVLFARRHDR